MDPNDFNEFNGPPHDRNGDVSIASSNGGNPEGHGSRVGMHINLEGDGDGNGGGRRRRSTDPDGNFPWMTPSAERSTASSRSGKDTKAEEQLAKLMKNSHEALLVLMDSVRVQQQPAATYDAADDEYPSPHQEEKEQKITTHNLTKPTNQPEANEANQPAGLVVNGTADGRWAMDGVGAMGRQTPKEKMEVTERKMTMETEE